MTVVLLLIPLAFVLVAFAVAALFWAVDSGQYDNLDDAANSPLESDDPADAEGFPPVSVTMDSPPDARRPSVRDAGSLPGARQE
jgi:cbb3-type cytochrome oxidase maturation protein